MDFTRSVLVVFIFVMAVVVAVPTREPTEKPPTKQSVPPWHQPCGSTRTTDDSHEYIEKDNSMYRLKLQHQQVLLEYLNQDYEYLYERLKFGFHEHQIVAPSWLPARKEISRMVRRRRGYQTILRHLPTLHRDLQKFAVALEPMVEHENRSNVKEALKNTQTYLLTMLCEVENTIESHSNVEMPDKILRSIMPDQEREPLDDTRRLLRDWSILVKYKDYLHAWRHVFDY